MSGQVQPWEPTIIMWAVMRNGAIIRHNFYRTTYSAAAIERVQEWEYERGCVAWLEYRAG